MAGIDFVSSLVKPEGGSTSGLNLNASLVAGTSRNCLGRKLCGSFSRLQAAMIRNTLKALNANALVTTRRRFRIKRVLRLPDWIFDLRGATSIQLNLRNELLTMSTRISAGRDIRPIASETISPAIVISRASKARIVFRGERWSSSDSSSLTQLCSKARATRRGSGSQLGF